MMAAVRPFPAIGSSLSYREMRVREDMSGSVRRVTEDKIYVAVGKPAKEYKSVLVWGLQNSGGRKICIIHVHQPAQMIPVLGTKFPAHKLKEQEVTAYRELEKQDLYNKVLPEYLLLCRKMGMRAETLIIEHESVETGILELIADHRICKLVMGAAADKRYSRNMMDIKSNKAISVFQKAPGSCHIWFTCKGNLIHTREGSPDGAYAGLRSPPQRTSPNTETGGSNHFRSPSIALRDNKHVRLSNPALDLFLKVKARSFSGQRTARTSSDNIRAFSMECSTYDRESSIDECEVSSRQSISQGSTSSSCPSGGTANLPLIPIETTEEGEIGSQSSQENQFPEVLQHSSPPSVLGGIDDPLYDQLQQAVTEAVNLKREALIEAVRRAKAERDAVDAIRRAKASESLYAEESKHRKEIEEALAKEKEQLQKIKCERDEIMDQLRSALDQKSILETQISECHQVVKELEQKILSAVDLLQNYKRERDELQLERDNALSEAEELRRRQTETSSTHIFSEFSFSEVEEATFNFDPSLKIGEGGYGSIYKGLLHHTQVAIKMLNSHSLQGPSEFQQEVDILTKMRHPNLVTLIGACPEAWTLIYEYLPNGSLEDRLNCRDNSPPLSWQTRVRIAAELCSVLIFLHSTKPHSIVHGDLKPANILLDVNFICKLSDFGLSRVVCHDEGASSFCRTDPKGTFSYMDPEFLASGELTTNSDVYSFGVILLRLLTGKPPLGITKEVQYALDKGNLKMLLDPLAGDWPFVQAEQLANLALRCCELNRKGRPDLASDVLRILEPMRASCGGSSCFRLGSGEHFQPPPYFICPIFQEVMQDPHVAADGYTYEAEALRGWLDSGHDTSPMTNLKLAHTNLVPNHALRSAIQEWLQHH